MTDGQTASRRASIARPGGSPRQRYVRQFGIDIPIDPQVMSWRIRFELWRRDYEMKEAKMLDRIIDAGERVLELGTGIGFVSTVIARNPKVERLVTYEANPRLAPFIRRLANENLGAADLGKVEFRNAVLFNKPDAAQADFYISKHFWGSSLLPIRNAVAVEKVSIDDFDGVRQQLRPTLIVCDIEGGELGLFRDADLTGIDKVYLETHPWVLGPAGMADLMSSFVRHGFEKDHSMSTRWVMLFRRKFG
ncbi:MAG: FkbM family methyltransferase [Devosia sp.]